MQTVVVQIHLNKHFFFTSSTSEESSAVALSRAWRHTWHMDQQGDMVECI